MQFAQTTTVVGMQELDHARLADVSGGAYFWDDLQGTINSATDTPTTNLIPLPR